MPLPRFIEAFGQEKKQSTIVQDQELMDQPTLPQNEQDKEAQAVTTGLDNSSVNSSQDSPANTLPPVPLQMKLLSVLLVSCIGFGSQWSSGVSSAMKSTMKARIKILCITFPKDTRRLTLNRSKCTSITRNSPYSKPARIL